MLTLLLLCSSLLLIPSSDALRCLACGSDDGSNPSCEGDIGVTTRTSTASTETTSEATTTSTTPLTEVTTPTTTASTEATSEATVMHVRDSVELSLRQVTSFECNSTSHTHCYVQYKKDALNTGSPIDRWNRGCCTLKAGDQMCDPNKPSESNDYYQKTSAWCSIDDCNTADPRGGSGGGGGGGGGGGNLSVPGKDSSTMLTHSILGCMAVALILTATQTRLGSF